jgi:signal transduction histidine kinase
MITPETIIPAIIIAIGAGLFVYVQIVGDKLRPGRLWLSLTLVATCATALSLVISSETVFAQTLGRGFVATVAFSAMLISFGALLIRDVTAGFPYRWLIASLLWLFALTFGVLLTPDIRIAERGWLDALLVVPDLPGVLVLGGLLLAGICLVAISALGYTRSNLPEVANRALLWALLVMAALGGGALIISGVGLMMQAGALALLLAAAGAVYAQSRHRAFNLRHRLFETLRLFILVLITTVIFAAALLLAERLGLAREQQALSLTLVFALLVALIYIPARQIGRMIAARLFKSRTPDPAFAARRYSQAISRSLELRQFASTISQSLVEVMGVRRAGLILVTTPHKEDASVVLTLLRNSGGEPSKEVRGKLGGKSMILGRWVAEGIPLVQFDLEYAPDYQALDAQERQFFRDTGMSAYAPIVIDNHLIGALACGAKNDDSPFASRDLDLLTTLADQTGAALRNTLLLDDLRRVNDEMQVLNRGLEATRDQMEKLDAVKTDFITIASHELRTPLAQIRGYIDVADALNEQGMVDQDRLTATVDNVRKATERMEELIAAMLDVSQLDVKAMDLRFTQTSLESILKMSVEPLIDAARQRKLSLAARGLRGLPVIEADMQRLVQAFRNVIVNAIKFTPDGGRIDINAEVRQSESEDSADHVLITVADTGVGIDKKDLELIFNKFYRTSDPSNHSTGTYKFMGAGPGLGLTIARGVIEGHGGRIWVESPGHDMEACPGSTFYIELPLQPRSADRHPMTFASGDGRANGKGIIDTTVQHAV